MTYYCLVREIGIPDNGSHDVYYFVNTGLGAQVLKREGSKFVADSYIYTSDEVQLLEDMQGRNTFASSNGPCITIVRVDELSVLDEYDVCMSEN